MEQTEKEFLKSYDKNKYEKPSVTIDIIVISTDESFSALRVLLIKRKKHPFKDCWAIPGGFLDIYEGIEDGARRELKEETNVDATYLKQIQTFGDVNRDPRMRVISIAYLALIERSRLIHVHSGDDAKEAQWFLIHFSKDSGYYLENECTHELIDLNRLAFDHKKILLTVLEDLKKEVLLNEQMVRHLVTNQEDLRRVVDLIRK